MSGRQGRNLDLTNRPDVRVWTKLTPSPDYYTDLIAALLKHPGACHHTPKGFCPECLPPDLDCNAPVTAEILLDNCPRCHGKGSVSVPFTYHRHTRHVTMRCDACFDLRIEAERVFVLDPPPCAKNWWT